MIRSAETPTARMQSADSIGYCVFKTAWGPFGIVGRRSGAGGTEDPGSKLLASYLPGPTASQIKALVESQFPDAVKVDSLLEELQDRVKRYFAGERITFRVTLDVSDRTPFQRAVIAACRRIRPGRMMSYAALAESAGYPRAARAVGSVMSNNRTPLIVPCHRVVASSGLGGFSANGGISLKQAMLELEGAATSA